MSSDATVAVQQSPAPRLHSEKSYGATVNQARAPLKVLPVQHGNNPLIPLSITPASAASLSRSSSVSPSDRSPRQVALRSNNFRSSPEGPRGRRPSNVPGPLSLPESVVAITPRQTAMSEAMAISQKGTGLIRRLSRGARNGLTRRRQSSTTVNNRDLSSGPVVMRRRSDSNATSDYPTDYLESSDDDSDGFEDDRSARGLGLDGSREHSFTTDTPNTVYTPGVAPNVVGPVVPFLLQQGVPLTKVTKKKRKTRKFTLDIDAAKVSWDSTNKAKKFYVDDIQKIYIKDDAKNFRSGLQVRPEEENRTFTVVYNIDNNSKGRQYKTMTLVAPDEYTFECWVRTLEAVQQWRLDIVNGFTGFKEEVVKAHWQSEMAKKFGERNHEESDEKIDREGVRRMCRSLHIECSRLYFNATFARVDTNRSGNLDFSQFLDFIGRVRIREDLRSVYNEVAMDTERGLDLEEFLKFLRDTQKIDTDFDPEKWQQIFYKSVRKSNKRKPPSINEGLDSSTYMTYDAFSTFLTSRNNAVLPPVPTNVKLDRPLNEYFISSSHNTYLLGRQVAGESSVEAYARALSKGCRCIEVDCWDGPDGQPIVNHGRTMTKPVKFRDVMLTIAKHSFKHGFRYPVIISLEVHCSQDQQLIMANTIKETLGEWLITEPLDTSKTLPSPEALKEKILIKVKSSEERDETMLRKDIAAGRKNNPVSSPLTRPLVLDNSGITPLPLVGSPPPMTPPERSPPTGLPSSIKNQINNGTMASPSSTEDSDGREGATSNPQKRKKQSKIGKPLGDLGVYTRGQKYNSFNHPDSRTYNHVFSFSERTFEKNSSNPEAKALLEKHNVEYLMRVYPAAYRWISDNFDPLNCWRRGVQMVALNWQTWDVPMQLNDAMFAAGSDRQGYVLKPSEMRQPQPSTDTTDATRTKIRRKQIRFSVEIISAQQLPRPTSMTSEEEINPYVEVETYFADDKAVGNAIGEGGRDASARNGMSGIGAPLRRQSKIVQGNGYNPIYHDPISMCLETKYPDLVFARFTVNNSHDGKSYTQDRGRASRVASFTAKVSSLQEGYRHLPLYDASGERYLFSTLFVKISKKEIVDVEREKEIARAGKVESLKQNIRGVFARSASVDKKEKSPPLDH